MNGKGVYKWPDGKIYVIIQY